MISSTFNRYIWLVNNLIQAGRLTFEEISRRWERSSLGNGKPLPLRTFHDHRKAVEELFQINIECDTSDGYKYYIEDLSALREDKARQWLLNSFSTANLITEGKQIKDRILLEEIPEDSYIFEFVTTDGIGHYSLSKEVSLEVLGDSYASSLRNRSIASVEQREDGSLALIWEPIASNNIQHTTLEYELNGESHSVKVENGETETLLTGLNIGDEVVVFSTFLPPNAFETFDSPRRSYVLE